MAKVENNTARIAMATGNGYLSVYLCTGGREAYRILRENYKRDEDVERLLGLGDLLELGDSPESSLRLHNPRHPFSDYEAQEHPSIDALRGHARNCACPCVYIYEGHGNWDIEAASAPISSAINVVHVSSRESTAQLDDECVNLCDDLHDELEELFGPDGDNEINGADAVDKLREVRDRLRGIFGYPDHC